MNYSCDLEPGDKLTVLEFVYDEENPGLKILACERKCTVIREYRYFILVDYGAYRESISKANLICEDVKIVKGWKE